MTITRNRLSRLLMLLGIGLLGTGTETETAKADFAVQASNLESFLDLPDGTLDGFANGPVIQGSAIRQTFSAGAGETLSFGFNFLTNEPEPASPLDFINHFAFVSLLNSVGEIVLLEDLADVIESRFPLNSSETRLARETGFQNFSFEINTAGTFTLGIGVVNVTDDLFESGLLIDNLMLTTSSILNPSFESGDFSGFQTIGFSQVVTSAFGSGPIDGQFQAYISTVPEPSGVALTAIGLVSLLGFYRRRQMRCQSR